MLLLKVKKITAKKLVNTCGGDKAKKGTSQLTKIKTSGSTFKNPIKYTDKRVTGINKIKCSRRN